MRRTSRTGNSEIRRDGERDVEKRCAKRASHSGQHLAGRVLSPALDLGQVLRRDARAVRRLGQRLAAVGTQSTQLPTHVLTPQWRLVGRVGSVWDQPQGRTLFLHGGRVGTAPRLDQPAPLRAEPRVMRPHKLRARHHTWRPNGLDQTSHRQRKD
jgi:hypothetical protein